ncbi:N-acyl homoserine lactonase family protein [Rhodococcus fascians]|nr:N-acyl homoserine lactonase family protein [Rhodococcus fascians]
MTSFATSDGSIPVYQVTALRQGWLEVDRSSQTYMHGYGESIWIPVWAYLIQGKSIPNILVDTGIDDPGWVTDAVAPCRQSADETITGSLRMLGLEPEDIEIVVNTHLHYDHSDNNPLFAHARFFVSRIEWDSAAEPFELQEDIYTGKWLAGDLTPFHYTLIEGKYFDIAPGIRVMQTPGHCPGIQSILVNTAEGVAAICGDAMNSPENIRLNTPPGIVTDVVAAMDSIHRIVANSDIVLTGHDPGLEHGQSSGFPRVEDFRPAAGGELGDQHDQRVVASTVGPA